MLDIRDLSVSFTQYRTGLRQNTMTMISNLSLSVSEGQIMAVVGSSGSGKSLLAHTVLGILPDNAKTTGSILFKGKSLTAERQQKLRGREIALIPQSVNFLDPLMRVGAQVRTSARNGKKDAIVKQQKKVFKRYGLGPEDERLYPFQLSGGMARRVLVSSAVVNSAELIIADEPTPGLHPEIVQETLGHLREIADTGSAVILITHDIGTALGIADQIAVFYAGTVVEVSPADDFKNKGRDLRHPYTQALWRALPENEFVPISGSQPTWNDLPQGCLFEPRCRVKTPACMDGTPPMRDLRSGKVRCIHAS